MKKKIAVLGVITQMSIYKIIMVLLFMGISQVAFAYMRIKLCISDDITERHLFSEYMSILLVYIIFMLSFLMITLILYWTYHEKKLAHTTDFFKRLSIGRNGKFAINILYSLFCYFLLFGWQICISRVIEWFIRSMTNHEGDPIYQYISGVYDSCLLNGIFAVNGILVLVTGVLFLALFSIVVAKSEWQNKPPIGIVLIFVWYATSIERFYSVLKCVELTLELSICILYVIVHTRKQWQNEKNIGE